MFYSVNPYTQELMKSFENHSAAEIEKRLHLAEAAYADWRALSIAQRAALFERCAAILLERKEEFARLITLEMGKIIREARSEVEKCALACQYYASNTAKFLAEEPISTEAAESFIAYRPLGAVFAIMPWNFPFWQLFRFACPALMAGNVTLVKPAPNVAQCALAIESIFYEAGFPEGVFQSLLISVEQVESIIAQPIIQAVTFTGSERAGAAVAKIAGKYIKKIVLELGGSDAFIVLPDADLHYTAEMAVKSRMINNGQSCLAAKRFILHTEIEKEFIGILSEKVTALKHGNPLDEKTDYSVIARNDLAYSLAHQVESSLNLGAKLIIGGKHKGTYYEPTIIRKLKTGMLAHDEELFGPIFGCITAKTEEETIQIANHSKYGLGASIWTKDTEKAKKMAAFIEAGCVFINETVRSDVRVPFGGVKKSGYGRELSYIAMREFCNIQSVWIK